jgi:signal transduction histidine kinase
VSAITIEIAEHRPSSLSSLDADFVREIVFFAMLGPLAGGVILTLLDRTTDERIRAIQQLSQQRELSQQLAGIQSWDELTDFVVRYPQRLAPVVRTCLFVDDPELGRYQLAAEWRDSYQQGSTELDDLWAEGTCYPCQVTRTSSSSQLFRCRCGQKAPTPSSSNHHCLPLVQRDAAIALLHLHLPPGFSLSVSQIDAINGIAPALASAIHDTRPHRSAAIRAEATKEERRRIARDLHDTLGQSLGYLHLKLDQLTGDATLREIDAIRYQLERMRDVANESYEQVRKTVSDLHSPQHADLASLLLKRAHSMGERAGFRVELSSEGHSHSLPSNTQRQVLYLFREALNNVEKHANAGRVDIHLAWTDDRLKLRLTDDGRGFEPGLAQANGHFGLTIMRERAEEAGGELDITSAPGSGTSIVLTLPLVQGEQKPGKGAR